MAQTRPLSDALGAEIGGVQVSARMSDADFTTVETALNEQGAVVLPGQTVSPEDFVAFARRFGPPEPHVIDQFHHPVDPNILILSNVKRDGQNIGLADGGTYFHTDYSYLEVPARCTMLYAIQVPEKSGTTLANQRRAWEDLPAETKARIDGMIVRHHYGNRDDLDDRSRTAASPLSAEQKGKVSWVWHPLVRRHPHTGRKCLYAVSGSSFSIEGMGDNESRALLDDLKQHSTQARYLHRHDYRVGDIVIWDNCQMLHSAPLVELDRPRTLWRITVKEKGPTLAAR